MTSTQDLHDSPHVARIDRLPRGLLRVHYRGGLILDVPAGEIQECAEVIAHRAERAAREAASSIAPRTSMAARCGCWHRADGTHSEACEAAGYVTMPEERPAWREVSRRAREKRHGEWFDVITKVLVTPVEVSAQVTATPSTAASASTDPSAPEIITVIDTETTGLKRGAKEGARITEIAAVVIDLGARKILGRFQSLIDPGVAIPSEITRLTGITDAMVRGQPSFAEVWPRVLELVATHCPSMDVVAHNAAFDRGQFEDAMERAGLLSCDWPRWRWRDSKTMASRVIPGLPSYSLSGRPGQGPGLRESLKLPAQTAHRAMGDVLTTCSLLRALRERAGAPWATWCGEATVWGESKTAQAAAAKGSGKTRKKGGDVSQAGTADLFSARQTSVGGAR